MRWLNEVKGFFPRAALGLMFVTTAAAVLVALAGVWLWYEVSHGALDHLTK
jgi:hypothetical protein